jgi:hypothetical protein
VDERRRVDVVPWGEGWAVVLDRGAEPHTVSPSRAHAVAVALQMAQMLGALLTIEPPAKARA